MLLTNGIEKPVTPCFVFSGGQRAIESLRMPLLDLCVSQDESQRGVEALLSDF